MFTGKNKKSILIILLVIAISLFGCGQDSDIASSSTTIETEQTTDEAISEAGITSEGGIDDGSNDDGSAVSESGKDKTASDSSQSSDSKSDKKSSSASKSKSKKKDSKSSSDKITVSISIDCLTLYKKDPDLAAKVSSKGVILGKKNISLKKNATVLDALKATGISFTGTEYISKINGLSEKDGGKLSGWMYKVNGEVPMESCNKYTLSGGDNIQWKYTCNNGTDI